MSESVKGIVIKEASTSKILIVYHSGSGSTKTICEVLKTRLSKYYIIDMYNLFHIDNNILNNYDLIVFGFPTYHCQHQNQ
ncbi:flavodoxin family protein [Acetivibrio straminisolvens]|uniref:flavodoxin family protein n=1 Tax=Acetivibrio straminisolvens TaxID=253314 RepID=UPI000571570D|nr:flavodoxin domain-containing protein [Acetivibrio straminisolvens]